MKLRLLIFEGARPPAWVSAARDEYAAKIAPFFSFEIKTLKSPVADRDGASVKQKLEARMLLEQVDERDLLILFDERGKLAKSSEDFAAPLARALESGKTRVIFVIGGPYGFADEVKARADLRWSLSPLTMNHWVASLVAVEQIYRGLTILRGIPYHNR